MWIGRVEFANCDCNCILVIFRNQVIYINIPPSQNDMDFVQRSKEIGDRKEMKKLQSEGKGTLHCH